MSRTNSRKTGRPSRYTEAVASKICTRLAEGESLRRICDDPKLPAYRTVLDWRRSNDEFRELYVWPARTRPTLWRTKF